MPGSGFSPHGLYCFEPSVCNRCKLEIKIAHVRIEIIQLVKENVRHSFIPPVIPGNSGGIIKTNKLSVLFIEIFLAHEGVVPPILVWLIDPTKRGANNRRQNI